MSPKTSQTRCGYIGDYSFGNVLTPRPNYQQFSNFFLTVWWLEPSSSGCVGPI